MLLFTRDNKYFSTSYLHRGWSQWGCEREWGVLLYDALLPRGALAGVWGRVGWSRPKPLQISTQGPQSLCGAQDLQGSDIREGTHYTTQVGRDYFQKASKHHQQQQQQLPPLLLLLLLLQFEKSNKIQAAICSNTAIPHTWLHSTGTRWWSGGASLIWWASHGWCVASGMTTEPSTPFGPTRWRSSPN